MTETEASRILQSHLVIEGHRDVYEQVHRTLMGESSPLGDAIVPRLIRDRIDLSVYAVGGDSWAHSQNTGRFLEATLDNIDQFLQEMSAPGSRFSLVKTRDDQPVARLHDHVKFILHLEGGKPLQGGIAQLRNFYRLGVRSMQPTWNLRNELGDGVGAVDWDVGDGDAARGSAGGVDDVVAGGEDRDEF